MNRSTYYVTEYPFLTEMKKLCLDIEAEIDNLKIKVYCESQFDCIRFHVKIITP